EEDGKKDINLFKLFIVRSLATDPHRRTQTYPLQTSAEDKQPTLCGMKKVHHEVLIGRLAGRLELMSQQTLLPSSSVQIVVEAREKKINCPTFLFQQKS
ncbi:MAG: hypothetical protein J7K15_06775, partial [Deltaproteobacteria bacterium]|nr:hypothetical protein [Deltaproteobacteria bacterium]